MLKIGGNAWKELYLFNILSVPFFCKPKTASEIKSNNFERG